MNRWHTPQNRKKTRLDRKERTMGVHKGPEGGIVVAYYRNDYTSAGSQRVRLKLSRLIGAKFGVKP